MSSITKRVLLNALVTPGTVIPFLAGIAAMCVSEILGPLTAFVGLSCVVVGIATMACNLLFNFDKIYEATVLQEKQKAIRQREQALDALDDRLCMDQDPRDQNALRNVRLLYRTFQDDLEDGKLTRVPGTMLTHIDDIYKAIINNLERQFDLWQVGSRMSGNLKTKLLNQRETLISEIEASIGTLSEVMDEVRALRLKSEMGELQRLQERLHMQLEITRGTEARLAELENNDVTDYSQYEH